MKTDITTRSIGETARIESQRRALVIVSAVLADLDWPDFISIREEDADQEIPPSESSTALDMWLCAIRAPVVVDEAAHVIAEWAGTRMDATAFSPVALRHATRDQLCRSIWDQLASVLPTPLASAFRERLPADLHGAKVAPRPAPVPVSVLFGPVGAARVWVRDGSIFYRVDIERNDTDAPPASVWSSGVQVDDPGTEIRVTSCALRLLATLGALRLSPAELRAAAVDATPATA